ncbi:MAG TPA: methyl-accepting chemotaxis protein [Myxococcota bacterium]|nr:methyl-accepting chemotaxis protein [Myxococcota bacterium]
MSERPQIQNLPTGAQFRRSVMALTMPASLLAVVLMSGYLMALLRLPADQWSSFRWIVGILFVILAIAVNVVNRQQDARIVRGLERLREGLASPEDVRHAFVGIVDLPRQIVAAGMAWWLSGGAIVAVAMRVCNEDFRLFSGAVMIAAAGSGGLVQLIFLYYLMRRRFEPIREALATQIPDPQERETLVTTVKLGRKLRFAVTGVTLVTLLFAIFLASTRAQRPIEAFASRAQTALLQGVVSAPSGERMIAIESARREAARLGFGSDLLVFDEKAEALLQGTPHALSPGELRSIREASSDAGSSTSFDSNHLFAWQRIPNDGRVLVLAANRDDLHGDLADLNVVYCVLVVFATLVALSVAWLVGRDVDGAVNALRGAAEKIASGDLTSAHVFDSEDELGQLARAFERMVIGLRDTIGRVAGAADRVEAAAGEIASVTESLAGVTVDQVRGIQQATVSMESINVQVTGIAESAGALNVSVEESSSSILELGAVGEELNGTASVLSQKVDEVSTSIEQMIRSVRQVAQNAEGLAQAAAETSSSMEEMASSLREVDANAAETARLSSRVVASSESGRERVRQTIDGMAAIREATETAERVIRSLAERAKEIGAIVGVIDDVADETNLLALNAAIIAAQAGDQGRAFSVVADQIKDLADRVLSSTKEIGGLIHAVQGESTNAIGAVERGSQSVQSGVDLSAEAGVSLEEITAAARESGLRIAGIVSAVKEQSKAATHVVELMERVRGGVEQIRAAGREQERGNEVVLRNSVAMREVATQVRGTTEEQARGSGRIRESVESVREAVDQINRSLQEQSAACRQAAEQLERVYERTRSNEESSRRMGEAMRGLLKQAETLRGDVQRFRI